LYFLRALPYPKEELSIHSHARYRSTKTANADDQAHVIAIAMIYWDHHVKRTSFACNYRFSLTSKRHPRDYPHFVLEPSQKEAPVPRHRLIFAGARVNSQIIPQFLPLANEVVFEFTTTKFLNKLLEEMSTVHLSLRQLSLRGWGFQARDWQTSQVLGDLERQLTVMKENGHPLKVLNVRPPSARLDELAPRWIEAGLVDKVISEH
jgi:hypothetical protein